MKTALRQSSRPGTVTAIPLGPHRVRKREKTSDLHARFSRLASISGSTAFLISDSPTPGSISAAIVQTAKEFPLTGGAVSAAADIPTSSKAAPTANEAFGREVRGPRPLRATPDRPSECQAPCYLIHARNPRQLNPKVLRSAARTFAVNSPMPSIRDLTTSPALMRAPFGQPVDIRSPGCSVKIIAVECHQVEGPCFHVANQIARADGTVVLGHDLEALYVRNFILRSRLPGQS